MGRPQSNQHGQAKRNKGLASQAPLKEESITKNVDLKNESLLKKVFIFFFGKKKLKNYVLKQELKKIPILQQIQQKLLLIVEKFIPSEIPYPQYQSRLYNVLSSILFGHLG